MVENIPGSFTYQMLGTAYEVKGDLENALEAYTLATTFDDDDFRFDSEYVNARIDILSESSWYRYTLGGFEFILLNLKKGGKMTEHTPLQEKANAWESTKDAGLLLRGKELAGAEDASSPRPFRNTFTAAIFVYQSQKRNSPPESEHSPLPSRR